MSGELVVSASTGALTVPTGDTNDRQIWKLEISATNARGNWNYYDGYGFQNVTGSNVILQPTTFAGTSPVIQFGNVGSSLTVTITNNTTSQASYMILVRTI